MYLEIISPEATLYSGDVTSVAVPSMDGEFEMMNNHAAIISILKEGHVKIFGNIILAENVQTKFTKTENRQGYYLPINSGTVEMKDNKVIVLVD